MVPYRLFGGEALVSSGDLLTRPSMRACLIAEGPRSGTGLVMAEYVGESLSHQEIRAVAAMRHTIAMVSVYSANDYFPLYQAPQPSISPRAALLHAPDASLPVACDRTRRRSTTTTPEAKSRENSPRKTPLKSGTDTCRPLLCFDLSRAL